MLARGLGALNAFILEFLAKERREPSLLTDADTFVHASARVCIVHSNGSGIRRSSRYEIETNYLVSFVRGPRLPNTTARDRGSMYVCVCVCVSVSRHA